MKMLLLTLFVALVASAPVEDTGDAVEVVVNGLAETQALEIADIVDIKLKKHVGGEVVAATDLLHPYSTAGIAEAIVAAESEVKPEPIADVEENEQPIQDIEIAPFPIVLPSPVVPEVVAPVPEPAVLPEAVAPEVVPSPVVLPEPVAPEVAPSPVVLPEPVAPEVVPSPVVLPEPVAPEVAPSPVVIPEPVAPDAPEALPVPEHQFGEIYNDGTVQVSVNGPEDAGIISTLQYWLNVVMNYFNNGAQSTAHII